MKGYIEKRVCKGGTRWRVRVRVGGRDAERFGCAAGWHAGGSYQRRYHHDTEPNAEDALAALLGRLRSTGQSGAARCTDTLRQLATRWLRDDVTANRRANTLRAHKRALEDHILEVCVRVDADEPALLGDLPGAAITPADWAEWQALELVGGRLDGKPGGCAAKSVRNYRGTAHKLYGWLSDVMPETFAKNPVSAVPAPRWKRKTPQPPTLATAQAYLEALRDTRFWPSLLLGSAGGMRRGEILAPRWCDSTCHAEKTPDGVVHLVGGLRIHAERGNLTGRTKAELVFGPPKTDKSARFVPLPEFALAGLIELKAERMRDLGPGAVWDGQALICCGRQGQPIVPDDLTHGLARTLKRRGLPPLNMHRLRHMVATEMRRHGVPPTVLAEFLGHADPATTAIYDHVDEADRQAAAERFQEAWQEAQSARCSQDVPTGAVGDELSARRRRKHPA